MNQTGIVLKYRPFNESDRLITLFTREAGLATLIARGAGKPGGAFAGRLEPLTELAFFAKRARALTLLTEARETTPFLRIKTTPFILSRAFVLIELLARLYPEGRRDETVYDLTRTGLLALERPETDGAAADLTLTWFKLNLLRHEGLTLRTDLCGACGTETAAIRLSGEGELLCGACLGSRPGAPVARTAGLLARIAALSPARDGLPPSGAPSRAAKVLVDRFFAATTGLTLHAERIFAPVPGGHV